MKFSGEWDPSGSTLLALNSGVEGCIFSRTGLSCGLDFSAVLLPYEFNLPVNLAAGCLSHSYGTWMNVAHVWVIYDDLPKIVMFHRYVKSPEGNPKEKVLLKSTAYSSGGCWPILTRHELSRANTILFKIRQRMKSLLDMAVQPQGGSIILT